MKIKLISLSMISFVIAIFSCIIALSIDKPAPEAQPDVSTTVSVASSPTSSGMHSNGPANLQLIDISHYDKVTDWNLLKTKVDGMYIKATEGLTYTDDCFNAYASGAINAKIPVGFYHYFWPNADVNNARQQADFFYNSIKKYKYALYPVLDVEETNKQSVATIVADVKAFADEIEKLSGHRIIIYCSQNFANLYLSDPSLVSYQLWIAHYDTAAPGNTSTWNRYVMWQYGDKETIDGITGPVDGDFATANVFINESVIGD